MFARCNHGGQSVSCTIRINNDGMATAGCLPDEPSADIIARRNARLAEAQADAPIRPSAQRPIIPDGAVCGSRLLPLDRAAADVMTCTCSNDISAPETKAAGACFGTGAHGRARTHRYSLWRRWDDRPLLLFIGLNPSTADERELDNTLRKVEKYARRWEHGGFVVGNAFAQRSTYPRDLLPDPAGAVGVENDAHLAALSLLASRTMLAWGGNIEQPRLRFRTASLRTIFPDGAHCWNFTKAGSPVHPLYQLDSADPQPFCWA